MMTFSRRSPLGLFVVPGLILMIGCSGGGNRSSSELDPGKPGTGPAARGPGAGTPDEGPASGGEIEPGTAQEVSGRAALAYIPEDAFAAIVLHPRRAAATELGKSLLALGVVKAGIRQSNIRPADVEQIVHAMGVPTDVSENDCTIVRFARPVPREALLEEEFAGLPYEEVQFRGATYYRYADEFSADEGDFLLPDASETIPEAAPVGPSTVLARYPGDLQPDANGHADSSGSGNWLYYSSDKQNPSHPDARLAELAWNPKESRYEGNELRVNRMWPAVGRSLAPALKSPRYAVLRWESRTSAALTIRGTFKAIPGAKSGDGVRVLVFVDGRQEFLMDVKRGDTTGVKVDVSAAVEPGWTVDFVVDPKANVGYDSTLLEATIERTGGNAAAELVDALEEPADDPDAVMPPGDAVYFPDDRTLVGTGEDQLKQILSTKTETSPLVKKLAQVDLEHDLVAVVALDGYRDQAAGLLELAAGETGWAELAGLAAMPKHAKSAVATLDLAGDRLLHLTLEADEEDSAGELHDGAKYLVGLLPGLRNLLPNEMPGAKPNPLLPLFDELVAGITVRRDALKVLVDVQSPDGLAEFVENDAETVVGSMVPPGAGPRPDVSTPGEFDQPEDTPKTVTHRPPPKDHPDFRDLAIQSHNCRIYFPGKPELEEQSVDTPAGKIEISTFMTDYKGFAYAFSILDYPPSLVRKAGAETLLNEYRGGIVDEPNGTLLDSKMSNYQGSPSNDFQYVDPDYGAGALAHCRTVLKGNRMFHLKVVGKAPAADVHVFFQSLIMADQAGEGPPADAVAAGEPAAAPTIIEPAKKNWEVGAGNLNAAADELVIDAGGRPYWLISRDALPANFRLQIEGRIEFLQGGQVLQNTQKDILRSLCVRFCTADQKADVLDAKGYHIRHSHTMLLLSKEGKIIARGDVGNGPRPVSAIPTGDGLKVTIPDREPWPFTMAITKKDDKIAIECNGAKVVDHTDRFYLTSSNKLAIGGYLSRLYLGRVTVTDLGPPKPPPGGPGGTTALVDATTERERFQPLLLRHPVDFMALTEDGRYLVAGHREADSLSVVDVRSLDLVKTIDTPAPAAVLCRGDQLIVANLGVGTLTVFSQQKEWEKLKSLPVGDPNPEYISAPGGRNYRGVVVVRGRGNGRDALPVILVNVKRGRAVLFNNGRTSAATVDYGGNVMVVQSRAGSPNRYIAGVYNFTAVSQGRPTPSMGEQLDSFPLLYQVGETPYWFGGRQVFAGMPVKPIVEAEQLLVADRVVNVCYAVAPNRLRCLGLDRTVAPIDSRPIAFPSGIRDATTVGDLHIAATIGEHLYFFLLSDDRTIQTVRLPAFEIPENLAKTDRAVTVAKAMADAAEAAKPVRRNWKDTSGRFKVEAELVEFKDGRVTLKKTDGSTVTVPIDRLCQADRDYLERRRAADTQDAGTPRPARPTVDWKNYAFAEAGFSADFPGKPDHSTEKDEEGAVSHTYEAGVQGTEISYSVIYDDLPQDALAAGAKAILDGVAANLAEITSSKKNVKIDGHPGIELLLEFEEDNVPLVIRNRVCIVGSRIFQVMVACPAKEKGLAESDRFLGSFKVLIEAAPLPATPPAAKGTETPRARREIALFNGSDLTGWQFMPVSFSKSKTNKTWVADAQRNVLVSLGGDDHNNLATVATYGDFKLSLEWRFRPGGDVGPNGSGIVVRADGLDSKGQNPKGIEIDLRPNKDVAAGIGTGCLIAYSTPARNHLGATDGELQKRQLGWIRELVPYLLRWAADPRNFRNAWNHCSQGGDGPGPNGRSYEDYEEHDIWNLARAIQKAILSDQYRPGPERKVRIPKGPGRGNRTLALQNIEDRVVGRACVQILQPLLDPFFDNLSFGSRPGRNRLHALASAEHLAESQDRWVWVVTDIRNAFDRVPLNRLLDIVRRQLPDERLATAIAQITNTGRKRGLRQGSALSPLLMNLYRDHVLDKKWRTRMPAIPLLTYVDDILLMCKTVEQAHHAWSILKEILTPAGLPLKGSPEMDVKNLAAGDTAGWLGFAIRKAQMGLEVRIASEAWEDLAQKLELTHGRTGAPLRANAILDGWMDQQGPSHPYEDRLQVLTRIESEALQQAFDEIPTRHYLLGRWQLAFARYCRLRKGVLEYGNWADGGGSARHVDFSAQPGRSDGAPSGAPSLPFASSEQVALYTDGCCLNPSRVGGWAYVFGASSGLRQSTGCGGLRRTTNNRAELIAAIKGLERLLPGATVVLVTDSMYVVQGINEGLDVWRSHGWRAGSGRHRRPLKNVDLWQRLDELLHRLHVTCRHVLGHTGHPENEMCDRLAGEEAIRQGYALAAQHPSHVIRQQ